MAGSVAAAVHIYTVISSLASGNPDIALSRLFVPSPGKVNSITAPPANSTIAPSTTLPAECHPLLEGYHLFT